MPLIDHTYFIGELNLPGTNKADVQERLSHFISKYEEKFLIEAMGYELYKNFITGLAVDAPNQVWLDLLYGRDYLLQGRVTKWAGLLEIPSEVKATITVANSKVSITLDPINSGPVSMIANYVYYWWTRNEATQTSTAGEVITNTENSTRTSPSVKQSRAWNEMVNKVWQLVRFIDANVIDYPEWQGVAYGSNYRYASSFNTRLKDIFYPINPYGL